MALGGARGPGTPQEIFQATYDAIPADDPFWAVVIGDPGVELLFDNAVYVRGAMTLQALRNEVGDEAFWGIIRGWAASKSGGNVTSEEFVAWPSRCPDSSSTSCSRRGSSRRRTASSAVSAPGRATFSTARARARANVRLGQLQRRLALGRY